MKTNKDILKKLRELKEELPNLSYNTIYSRLEDIVNDGEVIPLGSYLYNNIITSEEADDIARNELDNGNGIDRLRCFINNTYADDLYILNGYGNLSNVTQGEFKSVIDSMIDRVEFCYTYEEDDEQND